MVHAFSIPNLYLRTGSKLVVRAYLMRALSHVLNDLILASRLMSDFLSPVIIVACMVLLLFVVVVVSIIITIHKSTVYAIYFILI